MSGYGGCRPDDLAAGLAVAERLLGAVGVPVSEDDATLLLTYGADAHGLAPELRDRIGVLFEAALRGFFHCAARGEGFSADADDERFEQALAAAYPGAGAAFARLARSYWSLRVLEARLSRHFGGVLVQQLLRSVERCVGRAFFPEPSDEADAPAHYAAEQRRLLARVEAPIDVEELLFGNPLLVGNPLAPPAAD